MPVAARHRVASLIVMTSPQFPELARRVYFPLTFFVYRPNLTIRSNGRDMAFGSIGDIAGYEGMLHFLFLAADAAEQYHYLPRFGYVSPSMPASSATPATRVDALSALRRFLPRIPRYEGNRNHAGPSEIGVSGLSAAITHRLVSEKEVIREALLVHPFSRAEKFVQEVLWRRYWKTWLEWHPLVWRDWLRDVAEIPKPLRVSKVESGKSGVAVMDAFARQLIETGYLHNHARMWFAAWWVHVERLPWQLGAAFFLRHLLDGDAASNTLSWRWVAGLQTVGKTYLPRRSNLERWLDRDWLDRHLEGIDCLENPVAHIPIEVEKPKVCPLERNAGLPVEARYLLWVHEEDLSLERLAGDFPPPRAVWVGASGGPDGGDLRKITLLRRSWLGSALGDAAARAESAWDVPVEAESDPSLADDLASKLADMARRNGCERVVAARPFVGALAMRALAIQRRLEEKGFGLTYMDLPEDGEWLPMGQRGFFPFWNDARERVVEWAGASTAGGV